MRALTHKSPHQTRGLKKRQKKKKKAPQTPLFDRLPSPLASHKVAFPRLCSIETS